MTKQSRTWIPTKYDLVNATGKRVPDVIAPALKILFIGINPSLYSAAVGHHFARPGNRFWPVLFSAGFTDRLLSPFEERELLKRGHGITNLVSRATASADELSGEELVRGGQHLLKKIKKYRPTWMAFVGIGAYRAAFGEPRAKIGLQPMRIAEAGVWVLPNPSGINAHYQLSDLVKLFYLLRKATTFQKLPPVI